jgi:tight adherence protein B
VSSAALLAAGAGACAVGAVWEALARLDHVTATRLAVVVWGPVRAAGSGREPTSPERRRLVVTGVVTMLAAGWLAAGAVAGALAATLGPWLVTSLIAGRRRRWRANLAAGAPAAARAIADALAGGHSIPAAIAQAARVGSVHGETGAELTAMSRALELGEDLDGVLDRLRVRAADPAWDAVVAAIALQREAGGDLAGLLRRLASARDEARRAEADAKSLTAQARFTARLVAGMPLGAAVLSEAANPGYLRSLGSSPLTLLLAGLAFLLVTIALLAIGRIARVAAW